MLTIELLPLTIAHTNWPQKFVLLLFAVVLETTLIMAKVDIDSQTHEEVDDEISVRFCMKRYCIGINERKLVNKLIRSFHKDRIND